jgi:hypothetical protein
MLKTSGNTQIHSVGRMQSFSFKWLGLERRWEGGFWMELEAVGCENEIELAQDDATLARWVVKGLQCDIYYSRLLN